MVQKLLTTIGKHIEIAPYAGFAIATRTEIQRSIRISKAEILIHTSEVAFFTSERNHIGRIEAVILIIHIELVDTGLVGMSRDAIIRNAYGHPYGTTYTRTFTYHFHNPYFVRIGNRERFPTAVITIFLHAFSSIKKDEIARIKEYQQCYIETIGVIRNDKWLKRLLPMINKESSLIAVGVMHLIGSDGLIAKLRKLGYIVEPIR